VLSDRKYQGSYARIADVLKMLRLMAADLARFFEQVAFTVMVRNGDGHLKNFGVLYSDATDIRLAPMFDVVTTAIYRYTRYAGGPELEDQTLALKLRSGRHQGRGYPTVDELLRFGREVCGVRQPAQVLQRLAQGMAQALAAAQRDERIPRNTLQAMAGQWQRGMGYAQG
jgi:serine/threonine-protein kinase HipA